VLVYDFAVVDCPVETVRRRLLADGGRSSAGAAERAYREGEVLRARVAPPTWPAVCAKTVELAFGAPRTRGDATVLPLSWRATGTPGLFPRLEADLEVGPLGPDRTQLRILGSYDPPAGLLGALADRVLLHRVAEATVRGFLARLAEAVAESRSVDAQRVHTQG
jgi:hypothetical protein